MSKVQTLHNYQKLSRFTDQVPPGLDGLITTAFGLVAKNGDFANAVKRITATGEYAFLDIENSQSVLNTLGDQLWYITRMAERLGYSLEDVATQNVNKLIDRKSRGVIGKGGKK